MAVQPVGVGMGVSRASALPVPGLPPTIDEVRRLEAGQLLVEVDEAGGDAGDGLVVLEERLEVVEVGAEQVADGRDRVGDPLLGDVEDERLGLVDGPGDVVGEAVADLGDVAGDAR